MGIEFFDHGGRKDRPDYLIDYVPRSSSQATHNLDHLLALSNDELEAMLKPVLLEHGLSADGESSRFRSWRTCGRFPGQLAPKLISARTQQAEALGFWPWARPLSRVSGALSNQIIVPLGRTHGPSPPLSGDSDDVNDAISPQTHRLFWLKFGLGI